MNANVVFDRIRIQDWRQFYRVDIQFDPRVTILTGENGAGKTTILNALGQHFGWDVPLVRSPFKSKREVVHEFLQEHWAEPEDLAPSPAPEGTVGWLRYSNGRRAHLVEPNVRSHQFKLKIQDSSPVRGIHIASHRPVPGHAPVAQLSTAPPTKANAAENYRREVLARYLSNASKRTPGQVLKETIMTLCLVAEGGRRVESLHEAADTIEQFENILRIMLPSAFGFQGFRVELPDLYISTPVGLIAFDAISGGIASIIDIAYQIFMYSPPDDSYVAVIDEPENHLHPAMQRQFLADLLTAFPVVQFVVATHNPFIIGSYSNSRVYALLFKDGRVVSELLDTEAKSGTSADIFHEILGLQSTLPIWVEREVQQIVDRYRARGLTPENVSQMRSELLSRGLGNLIVEALSEFAEEKKKG